MKSYCLASSSAGNCFILEFSINGMPTRIMVECGISMRDIYKRLNEQGILLSSIQACLITHAHQDHCKSAKDIQSLGIPLFASKDTLEKISCKGNELTLEKPNRVLNGLFVMPFEVEHDIEGAVGFIIKTKEECVFFANDHKTVYAQLGDLRKQKKNTDLKEEEKKEINIKIEQHERNLNAHCSLHGTIEGLRKLDLSKCQSIFLMHLSDRYANEYRMKNEVHDTFSIKTYVCKKGGGIK